MTFRYDVVVIGAGMAGLTAATFLQQQGTKVCVLEKSRDVGGRMSTRRNDIHQWDHGAQYFTVRSPEFRQQVDQWISAGVVAPWHKPIGVWNGVQLTGTEAHERFVGAPLMKSPLHLLATGLEIHLNTQVGSLKRESAGWQINTAERTFFAASVLLALPAPQTKALLPRDHPAYQLADAALMKPCWALMLAAQKPIFLPFAGVFINEGPLAWAAEDSTKPSRNNDGHNWVLHATSEWSAQHLEYSADFITPMMVGEFNRLILQWCTIRDKPIWHKTIAHRWRYARGAVKAQAQAQAQAQASVWPDEGLALAGDWMAGGRIEGAFLSGLCAAQQLART